MGKLSKRDGVVFTSPLEGEVAMQRHGDAWREGGDPLGDSLFEPPSLTLPLKGGGDQSVQQALVLAARVLRHAGIETPELDARLLIGHATGLTHEALIARAGEQITPDAHARFEAFVARRLAGEPVSRIVGSREFYGREFLVGPHTLDPRPDTETLIDAALDLVAQNDWRERPLDILDLGTGTGCILVTLLAELPNARGIGTDINPGALSVAAENARRHGVADRAAFVASDWLDGIEGQFELIVSNPPYLAASEMAALSPEVSQDPRLALDGGADGLDAYRRIAAGAQERLRLEGRILLEIGAIQAAAVAKILAEAGFAPVGPAIADLAGRPRCVVAGRGGPARADGRRPLKLRLENSHVQIKFRATTDISRPLGPVRARPVATATRADIS